MIANKQWDKAEEAITQFFKKSVRTNQDVFNVITDGDKFIKGSGLGKWGKVIALANRDSELWADRDAWTDGLEELGYDGITHMGKGAFGGGNFDPHRVWIVFDKDHVFDAGALEGMRKSSEVLPPSGDFSKMLKDMFGKGMGR